jgi:hypothetical protein
MEPATMAALAQGAYQVYSMMRSSGGGIGKLLAAQTRMLREISQQLVIVNKRLGEIYEDVTKLRETTRRLPADTAREIVQSRIGGHLGHAREIFATWTEYPSSDHANVLARRQEEAEKLVFALTNDRSALIEDGSEALCPALCAAWFVELHLHAICMPYDEARIVNMAKRYEQRLETWIDHVIVPTLRQCDADAVVLRDAIKSSERYNGHECYHSIKRTSKEVGGGHGELAWTYYRLTATHEKLSAEPAPEREALKPYVIELETLRSLGIESSPVFGEVQPYRWTQKTTRHKYEQAFGDRSSGPDTGSIERRMRKAACQSSGFVSQFAKDENARLPTIEPLFARAVVYSHYLLTCRETLKSVRGVLTRAELPTGSFSAAVQ